MAATRTQRLRLGRGKSTLILQEEQASIVRDVIDGALPGVLERLEQEARDHYESAQKAWPVKSGRSKKAMNWWVRLPRGDMSIIEGFVGFEPGEPGSAYAHLIKGKRDGGKQSWRVHLQQPMRERAMNLHRDIVDRLVAGLAGD